MGVPSIGSSTPKPHSGDGDRSYNYYNLTEIELGSSIAHNESNLNYEAFGYQLKFIAGMSIATDIAVLKNSANVGAKVLSKGISFVGPAAAGISIFIESAEALRYASNGNTKEAVRHGLKALTSGVILAVSINPTTAPIANIILAAGGAFSDDAIDWAIDFASEAGWFDPLIIDLDGDGDGIELTGFDSSFVLFDMRSDGSLLQTGWVSADDGMLVVDINKDGSIANLSEILSESFADSANSGIEAIATLDSNNNGRFDSNDERFSEVMVWRDLDQDGVTDAGELNSLTSLGIEAIDLNNVSTTNTINNGNIVKQTTTATIDGTAHDISDVAFSAIKAGYSFKDTLDGITRYVDNNGIVVGRVNGFSGTTVDLDQAGINAAYGNTGNDSLSATGNRSLIMVGMGGSDTLTGGNGNDTLIGGNGSDSLSGGGGDDWLYIDASDSNFSGGSGTDVLVVTGTTGATVDLGAAEVEIVVGGAGDDTFAGGATSVLISGELGDDSIIGSSDDDTLEGGCGNDTLDGNGGSDIALYSGYRDAYELSHNQDGSITITHINTADGIDEGTDVLRNVGKILFADQTLHLSGLNNAPIATKDTFDWVGSKEITFSKYDLVKNDYDRDHDILSIKSVGKAVGGTVRQGYSNSVIFTPDEGFVGEAGFEYTVDDGHGGTSKAKAIINIEADLSDEFFDQQWHFKALNLPSVWKDYTGDGILIGNNENTGIDYTHSDIAPNYDKSIDYDFQTSTSDAFVDLNSGSMYYHGTGTTAIIAGANDGNGVLGVAYNSTICHSPWIK